MTSTKYTVVMLRVRQNERRRIFAGRRRSKSNTRRKDVRLLFVNAHSLVRRFELTGISNDARGRRDVRKQRQDKTVNLYSRIDVSGSIR